MVGCCWGGPGGGWGLGGEMTQALYAHMNNKTVRKKIVSHESHSSLTALAFQTYANFQDHTMFSQRKCTLELFISFLTSP
jgi:hypothetical protein